MATVSRDRIQIVHQDSIGPGNDIQESPVIPNGDVWQINRIIFADKAINDGLSGAFLVDYGVPGNRETIMAAYLLGTTIPVDINRTFVGDGSSKFRYIRVNNAAVNKEMYLMVEGFKRIGI